MKPVIALVGRPNTGKSTLFNRLTKSRDAIVADFAGLTRDRHYGDASSGGREFIVIDTGGFEPDSTTGIVREMARQAQQAVAEADAVVFVVDIRAGVAGQDHDIARYLRQMGKRVVLAVNKAEGMSESPALGEFHELGMGEPHAVSAAHGQGIRDLVDAALEGFEFAPAEDGDAGGPDKPIRLAVAGRPNVGKSTLINTWLGEERLVAFDQPGTTRDAIHVPFERQGQRYELIDTAGLRRKGRVFEAIEKFSVVKTLQAIEREMAPRMAAHSSAITPAMSSASARRGEGCLPRNASTRPRSGVGLGVVPRRVCWLIVRSPRRSAPHRRVRPVCRVGCAEPVSAARRVAILLLTVSMLQ